MTRPPAEDLQRLRDILGRASTLAQEHALGSVLVGLAGREGDPDFPELIDFVESELRVEDAIFRLTRERVVLLIADVDGDASREIVERILLGYCERSSRARDPNVQIHYLEVSTATPSLTVKAVLPALFAPELAADG